MGIFGAPPKVNPEAEQARLKSAQEAAARSERDKAAAEQAAKENRATSQSQQDSARMAFVAGTVQDDEESRRKFLKKV